MRAQADKMTQLADYLAAHPNAGNTDSPADAAAALHMVADLRNIQAESRRELRPVDGSTHARWHDARPMKVAAA